MRQLRRCRKWIGSAVVLLASVRVVQIQVNKYRNHATRGSNPNCGWRCFLPGLNRREPVISEGGAWSFPDCLSLKLCQVGSVYQNDYMTLWNANEVNAAFGRISISKSRAKRRSQHRRQTKSWVLLLSLVSDISFLCFCFIHRSCGLCFRFNGGLRICALENSGIPWCWHSTLAELFAYAKST